MEVKLQTRIIENQRTGEDEVIENPLMPEHVAVGRLIWYHGFTSQGPWDCPAVIRLVDLVDSKFYVRSLDDMMVQCQAYAFHPENDLSSYSRQTMRLATPEEVVTYLAGFGRTLEDVPEYVPV
jgi:hypothetical protein